MSVQINSIAIDIVLLPPDKVMQICKKINAKLWSQTKIGFPFDDTHLPHISLMQQYVKTNQLVEVGNVIELIASKTKSLSLKITGIETEEFDGSNVSSFEITKSAEILKLHESLLQAMELYSTTGDQKSWYQDPGEIIVDAILDYTNSFREKYSHDKFQPHITLGFGPTPIFNQPLSFTASRLAICRLGNNDTCRKILKEWVLK